MSTMYFVKNDDPPRCNRRGWKKIFNNLRWAPQTHPLRKHPRKSGKVEIRLTAALKECMRKINTSRAFRYVIARGAGVVDRQKLMTVMVFGGNLVEILEVVNEGKGDWGRVRTLRELPDLRYVNPYNYPQFFQRITVIRGDGRVVYPPPGFTVFPLLSNCDVYIDMKELRRV